MISTMKNLFKLLLLCLFTINFTACKDHIPEVEELPEEKINFIIGTDAFIKIDTWHRADELKHLVDFILFVREDNFDETPFLNLKERGFNYKLMQLPFWDVSSSDIRERVKHNKDICDIVPEKVAKYIYHNNVYKI